MRFYRVANKVKQVGKVDSASDEEGGAYIVVDTGPWILGRLVMIPAGLIEHIDLSTETLHIRCSKDEVKHSPDLPDLTQADHDYRDLLAGYYGPTRM